MAGQEQPNQSNVHGLIAKKNEEWTKRVQMKLINGVWQVKIDVKEGQSILTPRDVANLNRRLSVERRRQEMFYRRELRRKEREAEQKLKQETEKLLTPSAT